MIIEPPREEFDKEEYTLTVQVRQGEKPIIYKHAAD